MEWETYSFRLQKCEQLEMDFQNDYHTIVNALHTNFESIEEVQVQSKDFYDAAMKQQHLHERKIRQFDRQCRCLLMRLKLNT